MFSYKPLPGAEEQIYDAISDITISMKAVDHLDMPECVHNDAIVTLSETERKAYDAMKQDLVISLKGEEIDAGNAAALANKLSQMANGAVYGEDKRVFQIHDRKLDIETGIQLLTSLVAALPDIIMAIVEAIPKIIDGIINAVLNAIPLIIQAGIDLLISLIQALPQIITTIVQAIPQIISGIVNALVGNIDKIIMAGVQLFVALIENLPTIIVEIVKAVPQIIAGIVKAFGSLMYKIVEIGGNIVKGLWSGITQLASWLWDKVSGWISSIWDGICDFFGIHSPSKEMAWVGEMLVKGLAGSIDDNGDEAVKAAEGMAEDINGVMGDLAHDMQTALPTDFDVNGSIRSAVDGVVGKAASAFTIALNIATFNNYSSEDIRQLTNEVMETANQFAQRKGVVFA